MAASKLSGLLSTSEEPTAERSSEILQLLEDARLHRPDLVLEHGELALSSYHPATKPHWELISQIIRAAADVRETEIVSTFISKLMKKFPHSVRAFTLLGITQETTKNWDNSLETYMSVLKKEPMAPGIYKRQVAILKSQRKIWEAVAMLNYYLNFYTSDFDAWAELCALSLRLGHFSHALFAANELVLLSTGNYAAHITAGDVYMTVGGLENLLLARAHYSTSLDIRRHANLRALLGLWLCCTILVDGCLGDELEKEKNLNLLNAAQKGIRGVYANPKTGSGNSFVEAALSTDVFTGRTREKHVSNQVLMRTMP